MKETDGGYDPVVWERKTCATKICLASMSLFPVHW